jgi:hypothetical protein
VTNANLSTHLSGVREHKSSLYYVGDAALINHAIRVCQYLPQPLVYYFQRCKFDMSGLNSDKNDLTEAKKEYFMASGEELRRLSSQHMVIKAAMPGGNLVCAPIDMSSGHLRVLDSGTADGKV